MSTLTSRLERRGAERRPVTGTLLVDGRSVPAELIDLSRTGLRCTVASPWDLPPGRSLRAVVAVGGQRLTLEAEVVRVRDENGTTTLGLHFTALDPATSGELDAILDTASGVRTG